MSCAAKYNFTICQGATLTPIITQSLSQSQLVNWEGTLLARRTNSVVSEDLATYKIIASFANVSGSAATINALTPRNVTSASFGLANTWIGPVFVTSSNLLTLQVSGSASANITWHLHLDSYTLFN